MGLCDMHGTTDMLRTRGLGRRSCIRQQVSSVKRNRAAFENVLQRVECARPKRRRRGHRPTNQPRNFISNAKWPTRTQWPPAIHSHLDSRSAWTTQQPSQHTLTPYIPLAHSLPSPLTLYIHLISLDFCIAVTPHHHGRLSRSRRQGHSGLGPPRRLSLPPREHVRPRSFSGAPLASGPAPAAPLTPQARKLPRRDQGGCRCHREWCVH